ncbi:hypothetical protein [Streptomyces sp. NPDC020597]|uniref:hypothetical protein n=1 Tax=unclassified Streptomyces TaxID=2593676 RepID=UPI003798AD9D
MLQARCHHAREVLHEGGRANHRGPEAGLPHLGQRRSRPPPPARRRDTARPARALGTRRFRRTLAWHIARRPGGLVVLAIQYGHLRTALVSEAYAARSRDGIHERIDIETVRAVADTVADLNDDLQAGGGLSGRAARRAIEAGVPRYALTQRHLDLKNEFYAKVKERGQLTDAETRLRKQVVRLKEFRARDQAELEQLRADVEGLVRAVNQLTLEDRQLRGLLSALDSAVRVLPVQ